MFKLKCFLGFYIFAECCFRVTVQQQQQQQQQQNACNRKSRGTVKTANNGREFEDIFHGSQNLPDFIVLNAMNGTLWLNLGGGLDSFEFVLGQPPSTSSDLSLNGALQKLRERKFTNNVIINFHPKELAESLIETVVKPNNNFTVWVTIPLLNGPNFKESFNLNLISDSSFGLDSAFVRVESENLLLPADLDRIKRLIGDVYAKKTSESDVRFLRSRYKRLDDPNSFTSLFVESVLQLVENGGELLPDLQDKDASVYSRDHFQKLFDSPLDNCNVMITLRAGVLAKDQSLAAVKALLREHPGIMINAFSHPYDLLPKSSFLNILNTLGEGNVIFQDVDLESLEEYEDESTASSVTRPNFTALPRPSRASTLELGVFVYFLALFLL